MRKMACVKYAFEKLPGPEKLISHFRRGNIIPENVLFYCIASGTVKIDEYFHRVKLFSEETLYLLTANQKYNV